MFKLKASELRVIHQYGYGYYIEMHVNGDDLTTARSAVMAFRGHDIDVTIEEHPQPFQGMDAAVWLEEQKRNE